jgi:hypothetical protein
MREAEETHDPEPGARLREVIPAPPTHAVDWSTLHAGIVARAAPLLAGRRTSRPGVWRTLSGWAAGAIPLTAAAAVVVLLVLRTGLERGAGAGSAAGDVATLEEALADGHFSGSAPLLIAGATDDDLLAALLFYEEGER